MQRDLFEENKELFLKARAQRNHNDMVVYATELLKLDENLPWVWANRGEGLHGMGFHIDAILNYDRALALETSAITWNNKGAAYWDMFNGPKALECLNRAAEIDPLPQTFLTIGNIHKWNNDQRQAIDAYRKCIKLGPAYADGHLVLGMTLLRNGYLQEGWKEYEWRWKTDQLPPRQLKCPQWAGEDLNGKTILVYGEQGLGDIMQFARYATVLAEQYPKAKVIVEVRPTLRRLIERMSKIYAVINAGEKLPTLDYSIPMLTLVARFTPNIETIPTHIRGLTLRHSDVQAWKTKFEQLPSGLKIGVCWSGMARTAHPSALAVDRLRSTDLSTFAPLAKQHGIVWINLQKGPSSSQVHKPPFGMTIADYTEDMTDFYETACAMANCDLVISVDTAVVHVAASIGIPTWVLSRWDGCWRWFGDREDSPWYPSVRQFTQPAPGDWVSMMERVAKELSVFVQQHTACAAE